VSTDIINGVQGTLVDMGQIGQQGEHGIVLRRPGGELLTLTGLTELEVTALAAYFDQSIAIRFTRPGALDAPDPRES
jgi:hypothetical protein